MKKNDLVILSNDFASEIYLLTKQLRQQNEFVLAKQVLRCGTSVGANISEAQYAQSKADFIPKLSIALKEARETIYWTNFLKQNKVIEFYNYEPIEHINKKIIACLIASIKTAKFNILQNEFSNKHI